MKNMKKALLLIFFISSGVVLTQAQDKFFTKSGKIDFQSKTALEDIQGKNKSATCVIDTKSGAIAFSVLMKGFEFEKALMQEHFNENYVESNKFPKSEFKGTISNNADIKYAKDGIYAATVKGQLTLHGVTKDVETTGKIIIKQGKPQATAEFNILLADYNISIPAVVEDKVSKSVKINVDCALEPLK